MIRASSMVMLAFAVGATLQASASGRPGSVGATHRPDSNVVRWTAQSGSYRVSWTANDIVASRAGQARPVFSFRDFANAGLAVVPRDDGVRLTRHHDVAVISLTGSLLALRDTVTDDVRPSAHPSGTTRFWTIDLASNRTPRFDESGYGVDAQGGGNIVSLIQLASRDAIRTALSNDPVVRAAIPTPPDDLDDLIDAWRQGADAQVSDAQGKPLCYAVPTDVLTSFAIIGGSGRTLQVRLGLGGLGACRSSFVQLGVVVPASGALAAGFRVNKPTAGLAPTRFVLPQR